MTGLDTTLVVAMAPLPTARGNPFVAQMADRLRAEGCEVTVASVRTALRADVLHLHWPDHFVNRDTVPRSLRGAAKVLLMAALVRSRGRAVVWTVHNLAPHDGRHPAVERLFWPAFTRLVSGCVFLTAAGRQAGLAALPGLRRAASVVVPHGSYAGAYPAFDGSPADARRSLGLPPDAAPLLFFGQVRPYKNVPGLLAAFRALPGQEPRLVVAGDGPDRALAARIADMAAADGRVVVTGRVEDADVHRVVTAAVGVVLPYHDVFNSGSMFLALSLGRPVLVPRTDVFSEVQAAVGEPWVTFFDAPLGAEDLGRFADHARSLLAGGGAPDLSAFAWERLGGQIVAFYRRLVGRRSEGTG